MSHQPTTYIGTQTGSVLFCSKTRRYDTNYETRRDEMGCEGRDEAITATTLSLSLSLFPSSSSSSFLSSFSVHHHLNLFVSFFMCICIFNVVSGIRTSGEGDIGDGIDSACVLRAGVSCRAALMFFICGWSLVRIASATSLGGTREQAACKRGRWECF